MVGQFRPSPLKPWEPGGTNLLYLSIHHDAPVEVLSPDDRRKDVRAKIKEYLFYGVKLVWLVDPETRIVTVYRESPRGVELDEDDLLDCGEILPGFTCKVSDLFG